MELRCGADQTIPPFCWLRFLGSCRTGRLAVDKLRHLRKHKNEGAASGEPGVKGFENKKIRLITGEALVSSCFVKFHLVS